MLKCKVLVKLKLWDLILELSNPIRLCKRISARNQPAYQRIQNGKKRCADNAGVRSILSEPLNVVSGLLAHPIFHRLCPHYLHGDTFLNA